MYLLDWLKFKNITVANTERMQSHQPHLLMLGMQDDTIILEDNLAASSKAKPSFIMGYNHFQEFTQLIWKPLLKENLRPQCLLPHVERNKMSSLEKWVNCAVYNGIFREVRSEPRSHRGTFHSWVREAGWEELYIAWAPHSRKLTTTVRGKRTVVSRDQKRKEAD